VAVLGIGAVDAVEVSGLCPEGRDRHVVAVGAADSRSDADADCVSRAPVDARTGDDHLDGRAAASSRLRPPRLEPLLYR